MKTKILFALVLATFLAASITKAGENSVNAVDNQHEIQCKIQTADADYMLSLTWSFLHEHIPGGRAPQITKSLNYQLINVQTGAEKAEMFHTRFGFDSISVDLDDLNFAAESEFSTRVGTRFENFSAIFSTNGQQLSLQKIKISSGLNKLICEFMAKACETETTYDELMEIVPVASSCVRK